MPGKLLETPIEYLKGVGPKRGELLRKELNIFTFQDLLTFYPFRYVDRSKYYKINEINPDLPYIQVKGKIISMNTAGTGRAKRLMALFRDDTGVIELVWFQGVKWIMSSLKTGVEYVVFGKPNVFRGKMSISHPEMDLVSEESQKLTSSLQAVYSSTEKLGSRGLNSRGVAKLQKTLIQQIDGKLPETLSDELISKLNLLSRVQAAMNIHFPENPELLSRAQFRLKFEEFFFLQLKLLKLKVIRNQKFRGFLFSEIGDYFNSFYNDVLPFSLTDAQKRVIREIRKDLGSGKQMNRLLQGDVGSGKTIVALMAMLIALDNGCQACLMAPTEILANQHFETISVMLPARLPAGKAGPAGGKDAGIKTGLLTGSTKTAGRKVLHEQLENGELQILIGTHALIEDKVKFKNLGLVIIDEQHRFGVEQRAKMWKKGPSQTLLLGKGLGWAVVPHMLVMTATPIPRTLAMTLYGDLDVSVIDELPPGRKPVKTVHRYDSSRLRVFGFMKEQIKLGRQIYVVYPLIKESEKMDYKDLMDGFESIVREFPEPPYHVSVVHGQMKPKEKDSEMQRFVKGQTHIMVATNVIEVGVDVPNATVMVMCGAVRAVPVAPVEGKGRQGSRPVVLSFNDGQ